MKAARHYNKAVLGLPAFVIARNTRAVNAGLTIKRLQLKQWQLSSSFEGEPEAFIKAGFVEDVATFRKAVAAPTKHLGSAYLYMARPSNPVWHCPSSGLYRAEGNKVRMTITREPIPRKSWKIGKRAHAYEVFDNWRGLFNHYVARDLEDLQDVLPETAEQRMRMRPDARRWDDVRGRWDRDAGKWADDTPHYWVWSLELDEQAGLWKLGVSPEGLRKAAREDRHNDKSQHRSADDFRASLAKIVEYLTGAVRVNTSTITRHGKTYELDEDALERLEEMYEEMKSIVETATIRVGRDPDLVAEDEARERAQRELHTKLKGAGQNVELQSFLAKVVPLPSCRK